MRFCAWRGPGRRVWEVAAAAALLALLVLSALLLNGTQEQRELSAAQKRKFAAAKVTEVMEDNAEPDAWTEGRRLGQQYIRVKILTGEFKGSVMETVNYLNAYSNVDCREGTRIIVRLDLDDSGAPYIVSVPNYDRGLVFFGLLAVFILLLVLIGGKKGAMAVLGLGYTVACVWFVLVPLLLRGVPPIPATIGIVALTTAASLLLLTGFSKKTLCATLGCVGGVAAAGLFAAAAGALSPMNGFNMSEAEELVLRAYDSQLHISGLLVSGILIASLGAVMDVAMSISSAIREIYDQNPALSRGALFQAGMRVGRDLMGTDSNTLILAFAGSSASMLVLDYAYDLPLLQIINSNNIGIAVMQGLSGSFGIVLAVPVTVLLAVAVYPRNRPRNHSQSPSTLFPAACSPVHPQEKSGTKNA